jgi:CBS domain-containing protein
LTNYIHAVPVVNADDELVGIVTSYDVLYACFHGAYPSQDIELAH